MKAWDIFSWQAAFAGVDSAGGEAESAAKDRAMIRKAIGSRRPGKSS
jgi:hypothetical protein